MTIDPTRTMRFSRKKTPGLIYAVRSSLAVRMPVGAFSLGAKWGRYTLLLYASDQNSLDLVEAHLITSSVVEPRRPGCLAPKHAYPLTGGF